ncbi:MAG: tRNA (cytidine(34)-2'-O)-methyltransferase [Chlamydiia bacterium]|nr:tRNA (cytidine(34)-2'-O)-methyltransferase [Chlamydiia bacterium]
MEIILFEPVIPQNTGNIIRLCKATKCKLTLVKPLGFTLSEKRLRRAGLDYHEDVEIQTIDSLDDYLKKFSERKKYFLSSKASKGIHSADIDKDGMLIFGSETKGLPKNIHEEYSKDFYTIPMHHGARCLNLANSVSIVAYEGLRQQDFKLISL